MGPRGTTLVEVLVAILLVAMVTLSVFSVTLTSKRLGGKAERKIAAANAAKRVLERLKNYISADPTAATASYAPGGDWGFRDGSMQDSCYPRYALDPGCVPHDVSSFLPAPLRLPPYNMRMIYTVTADFPPGDPNFRPTVNVRVDWDEP